MLKQGNICAKNIKEYLFTPVRWKKNLNHWKKLNRQNLPVNVAINHFDDFYKNVYGTQWSSIRIALLSPHKYCAVVNNYSDTDRIMTSLENEGALNLKQLFQVQSKKLKEMKKTRSRERDLQNIYKLDAKLDDIVKMKQQEEVSSIYPENSQPEVFNVDDNENENIEPKKLNPSLEANMASADIDWSRQIDPSTGTNSGGLCDYIPATKLKGKEDFLPESQHYSYYSDATNFPVDIEKEYKLHFPDNLHVYIFENGNIRDFDPPGKGTTGVSDYYLMDGSSIFPVLALGLSPGDTVLDMCAAPGGKSLACLQTLYPDLMVCNDLSISRSKRIGNVMNEFFYDWQSKVKITHWNALHITDTNTYSKILVDVPCTTDRLSVMENENNIFKSERVKERIRLPELQADILASALKLVKPNGTVVYSTCSLSPIQNDGVVHMALKQIWEQTGIKLVVKDLTEALMPAKEFFRFADVGLRYGHVIVPYLPANFGPMYFCKIVRTQ